MWAPQGHGIGKDGVNFLKVGFGELDVGRRGGSIELGRSARAHGWYCCYTDRITLCGLTFQWLVRGNLLGDPCQNGAAAR